MVFPSGLPNLLTNFVSPSQATTLGASLLSNAASPLPPRDMFSSQSRTQTVLLVISIVQITAASTARGFWSLAPFSGSLGLMSSAPPEQPVWNARQPKIMVLIVLQMSL